MAAIFQLRRGSGSASLVDGELYVNKGIESLQYQVDDKQITLVKLDEPNTGSLNLYGDITASNLFVTGNVTLGGTITIGDSTSDSVVFNADLSSSIIPDGNKIYDLGNDSKWYRNGYIETITASFISGAIAGVGDIEQFSASVDSRLDQLEFASASLQSFTASQESKNSTLATYTASINADLRNIHESTASLNLFSASEESKNLTLATYTASINSKFVEVQSSTASLNTFSSSTLSRLTNLEAKSSSVDVSLVEIHSYTSSLKTAIALSGQDVTVNGNLTVNGTTTQINSTQVNIGENILELNFGGSATEAGIYTKDATGTSIVSGSILWDSITDYWKAGTKGAESKILLAGGDGVLSGSTDFNAFSTSVDLRITNLSSSLYDLSGSTYSVSSSLDVRVTNVSSSLYDLSGSTYSVSASFDTRITNNSSSLYDLSGSTYSISASFDTRITNNSSSLYELSGSSYNLSSSFDSKFTEIQSSTASLNTFSASVLTDLTAIHQTTASLNVFSASINFFSSSTFTNFSNSYDEASASFDYRITTLDPGNIADSITNLNSFTASTIIDLNNLESKSASVDISIASINTFSQSTNIRLTNLEQTSASLNAWSSSLTTTFATDAEVAAGYEAQGRGIVSGSSQIVPLLPTGVISGSSQISSVFEEKASSTHTLVSGSSQVIGILSSLNSFTSSIDTTIKTKLNVDGVISGSSQILGGSDIHSGSVGNYQFNSIGVNINATGVAGEIVATGDITAFYSSDEKLKENIVPIPNALEKVNQISGNTYDWKEGYEEVHSHKGNDVGVIAQEIEQILPQIVTNRDSGYKAVQYEKIIPLLIEAIKELSSKVDRLENK